MFAALLITSTRAPSKFSESLSNPKRHHFGDFESNGKRILWPIRTKNALTRLVVALPGKAAITAAPIARVPGRRPKFNAIAGIPAALRPQSCKHLSVSADWRGNCSSLPLQPLRSSGAANNCPRMLCTLSPQHLGFQQPAPTLVERRPRHFRGRSNRR